MRKTRRRSRSRSTNMKRYIRRRSNKGSTVEDITVKDLTQDLKEDQL